MPRRSRGGRPRRSRFLRLNDPGPRPLRFDDDDRPPPRIGDERPAGELAREFPPERSREAGLTGAARRGAITADDLSPETLLDESPSHSPSARHERDAIDTMLRDVDANEIGAGRDSAEPIDTDEDGADRPAPGRPGP